MYPSRAGRSKLRDVAHRHERPFGVVDERDALCLEVADHGLEIGHLEVGKGVISDRWGALEDQDLAAISAAEPDRDGALPKELESQRPAIEVSDLLK